MQIHIHKDGNQMGPFPLDSVREMVRTGSLADTDLAWHEGAADWAPLNTIPAYNAAGPAVAAARPVDSLTAQSIPQRAERSPSIPLGILGGLLAAIAGGALWGFIIILTNFEIGWLAIGIGAACGWGVAFLSRGGFGLPYQAIAALTSVFGILIGKYVAFFHFLQKFLAEAGAGVTRPSPFSPDLIGLFFQNLGSMVGMFDALWLILAMSAAWRIPSGGE